MGSVLSQTSLWHKGSNNVIKARDWFLYFCHIVNVALNKPAQQRNQWKRGDNISDASNGVDGFKSDLSMEGGQCVISANNQQWSYWWVNLTSIHSIHHITIYYRTDNIQWGTQHICGNTF